MKKIMALLLTIPVLLGGCGQAGQTGKDIQAQFARVATAEMEADTVAHMTREDRPFTIQCTYDSFAGATTTILAPDDLKGISATIGIDGLQVSYNGTALSSGDLENICPANCLPWLMESLAHGYLQSEGEETMNGVACHRLTTETAAMDGTRILCTSWLDQETLIPRYAEFTVNEKVILSLTMNAFSCTMKEGE